MASVTAASRRVPSTSEFATKMAAAGPGTLDRKTGVLTELNGADGVAVPEESLQPIPTGDLRLALTKKSPSLAYLNDIRMERLLDKLILLNYSSALPTGIAGSGLPRYVLLNLEVLVGGFLAHEKDFDF